MNTPTREELLKLAEEAGFGTMERGAWFPLPARFVQIERFTALVLSAAQAEREPVAWDEAQCICDLPQVDEVIRNLLADQTGDSATCMVRAILEAARSLKRPLQAQEQTCFADTLPEVVCPKCEMKVLSCCGEGCPIQNAYASKPSASGAGDELPPLQVSQCQVCHHLSGHAPDCGALGTEVELPAEPTATGDPMDEWIDYAKRSGLLNADGVATDPQKTQTAWFAFTAAWNRMGELSRAKPAAQSAQVPEWSLRSQIEISNALRVQLEEMQKHHAEVTVPALLEERRNRDKARIITGDMPLAAPQPDQGGDK